MAFLLSYWRVTVASRTGRVVHLLTAPNLITSFHLSNEILPWTTYRVKRSIKTGARRHIDNFTIKPVSRSSRAPLTEHHRISQLLRGLRRKLPDTGNRRPRMQTSPVIIRLPRRHSIGHKDPRSRTTNTPEIGEYPSTRKLATLNGSQRQSRDHRRVPAPLFFLRPRSVPSLYRCPIETQLTAVRRTKLPSRICVGNHKPARRRQWASTSVPASFPSSFPSPLLPGGRGRRGRGLEPGHRGVRHSFRPQDLEANFREH